MQLSLNSKKREVNVQTIVFSFLLSMCALILRQTTRKLSQFTTVL